MDHVIIGNGPAGVIAAETLKRTDPGARVRLIGDEPEPPYSRMALPYLLAGNIEESGTHLRHGKDHWARRGIELAAGRVVKLDPRQRRLFLDDGSDMSFDRLLIATGSQATRPPIPGMDIDGVENCWTLADARRIAAAARPGSSVVLMGAGFIGCIVLEALVARDVDLTIIEMEERMVPRMMDGPAAT
jgi:NADPH-dependent 2,4-dienoyl-CoA reductase/sulfur reductase-like enzyme